MSEPPEDDKVGYGKPPKAHQFKKGQSGNPNGRPRKSKKAGEPETHFGISTNAIGRLGYEPVAVTLSGKTKSIPLIEAIHRRRLTDAAKGGNRLLQREVIAEANAYENEQIERQLDRFFKLRDKKIQGAALIAEAKAKGRPEPDLIPHPDDIIIDEENYTVEIDGPETRRGQIAHAFLVFLRDHFVIRAAYQKRFPPLLKTFTDKDFKKLEEMAGVLNSDLNARLRWGPHGFWGAMRPYERKGYRFLEADVDKSLRDLQRTWSTEPALEPIRKSKRFAERMGEVLKFSTRSRERRIQQLAYERSTTLCRLLFGAQAVADLPKRFSAVRHARLTEMKDKLQPEERAKLEEYAAIIRASSAGTR